MTSPTKLIRAAVLAVGLAGVFSSSPAQAQVIFPPAAFIATAVPVLFGGHSSYYWGGHWYYRDVHGWQSYHDEPAYLHDWRGHHEVVRHAYEPPHRWHR